MEARIVLPAGNCTLANSFANTRATPVNAERNSGFPSVSGRELHESLPLAPLPELGGTSSAAHASSTGPKGPRLGLADLFVRRRSSPCTQLCAARAFILARACAAKRS